MRKLVFKNLFSSKSRKKETCLEEIISENGVTSRTIKKSRYFIRNIAHVDNKDEFDKWMIEKKDVRETGKRFFHILKKHSDKDNRDKILCKAKGFFYAVVGKDIYNIVFVHSVKMEISLKE